MEQANRPTRCRRRPSRALSACATALCLVAGLGCTTHAGALLAQAQPPEVAARDLPPAVAEPFLTLTGPAVGLAERTVAALRLIELDGDEADTAIAASLAQAYGPEVWRAVLDAMNTTRNPLPAGDVPDLLLALRIRLPADLEQPWAAALGRYELDRIADDLTEIANQAQAPLEQRRLAILALGEHRRLFAAEPLIDLTSVNQLEAVQGWAFTALSNLSHQPGMGADRAAWAVWWDTARRLGATEWQRMLHENLLLLSRQERALDDQIRERLVESQRALYRATAAGDRPAVLAGMLRDPLDPIRLLAMELARQRAEDNGQFDATLREQLRLRLDDRLARVREEAATLLGQLLDADAADEMARRLAAGRESVVAVQRALLVALTQMPRADAVDPAYRLLASRSLQPQAAGMLAAAIRAELVGEPRRLREIRDRAREALAGVQVPQPQLVTLLGLVVSPDDEEDWARIGLWLDATDDRVREAAAGIWAASDRSLAVLAERSDDAVIRPIALRAIAQRGGRPETLAAVVARRPTEPDDIRLWELALVALAERVPPREMLEHLDTLAEQDGETRQVREHMLTAAIERGDKPDPPTRDDLRLLIARAQTRVLEDAPALVVLDYEAAAQHIDGLTEQQADRVLRGLTRAYLADQRIDAALKTAARVLSPGGNLRTAADTDPLIAALVKAAQQAAELGRKEQATQLLTGIRNLLGGALSPELGQQLRDVQLEIDKVQPAQPPARGNGPAE